ncbi:MAG: galactokinase [Treponema sp.]|jgi:galactokinase|nr:galactokinase [Treponema sp.]
MLDIGQIHRIEYETENDRSHVVIAEAPGRIHFLGEPAAKEPAIREQKGVDSNGAPATTIQLEPESGYYLSCAIDRFISVAVSVRKDNSFRFYAADLGERKRSTLINLKYRREDRWANYLKTAIFTFMEMGYPMKGLNFSFCGNIPQQIGLASSTAIETAAAVALRSLFRVQISDNDLAKKLHKAHVQFFGSGASASDYLVCFLARKDQFMVFDVSSDNIIKIKSPLSRFSIIIVDSRVPRMGAGSELASRRAETLKGLEFLSQKFEGADFMDFASTDLLDVLGDFPEQIRRRSMHIVHEIDRIDGACDALQRSDIASLAKIIYHSHESLRDLYEISCPEVDWLVKRAQEIEGAAGSRMTGIGFGGCTYTIIRRELVEEYRKRLEDYERIFGFRPVIYEIKIATGARVVPERRRAYAGAADK